MLLLVLWVNSCRESQRKDTYKNYVSKVKDLASESQGLGKSLNSLLTTRGTKESQVEQELTGLAQQQEMLSTRARQIDPPGRLRSEHEALIEAFDLRFNGLDGMAKAFSTTAASTNATQAGLDLAGQMKRLVASDVIWDDLWKEPTKVELERQHVTGADVPDSVFVRNPDIATSGSMKAVWQRIHGASTGGEQCTPRGTRIVSVTANPAHQVLSTVTSQNTITTTTDLSFAVTVENSGCAQEVHLPVSLSILQAPKPLRGKQIINLINPGDQQTVTFKNLGSPNLSMTTLTVDVDVVPKEANTSNNTVHYPVVFQLPSGP